MERIQVADIEHSHMKSSPLPHSSSRSSRRPSKSSPPSPLPTTGIQIPLGGNDEIEDQTNEEITLLPQTSETPRLV